MNGELTIHRITKVTYMRRDMAGPDPFSVHRLRIEGKYGVFEATLYGDVEFVNFPQGAANVAAPKGEAATGGLEAAGGSELQPLPAGPLTPDPYEDDHHGDIRDERQAERNEARRAWIDEP